MHTSRLRSKVRGLTVGLALAAVLAGCANGEAKFTGGPRGLAPSPSAGPLDRGAGLRPYGDGAWPAYAATPVASRLSVRDHPGGKVIRTMAARLPLGVPLTLLVVGRRPGWVDVELPVRPNGTSGWVREGDVELTGLAYGLEVDRSAHRLKLFDRDHLMRTFAVGIGTRETPTPGGLYYLIELLRPPTPTGPYGPYAFGLSGFSTVIRHFNGGDGVIGLHGTDDPAGVGRDVSHGCVRMYNRDITYLAHLLPLGTPIRINA
ncbi:MAG: L,D-transpeptidase [Actinomycetes bacterium]